jgi:hypothetical protein
VSSGIANGVESSGPAPGGLVSLTAFYQLNMLHRVESRLWMILVVEIMGEESKTLPS